MAIPPPTAALFCLCCQPLSSHSCYCQPLLAFAAPIDGWLLHLSLLRSPLPTPLSAAPIIDIFFRLLHHPLFDLPRPLFNCCPSSFSGDHPLATTFNPCPLLFSGVVVSHPSWLVVALHLITPLPPVCQHLCLLSCCCISLSTLTGCCFAASASPCATASHPPGTPPLFYPLPPPPATDFFVPCC